jgi:mono-ADP-ribosyltransferase sirtuin 6
MSANYASGLSACESKGVCGIPEVHDTPEEAAEKVRTLSQWIVKSRHCVLLVGAGISTSAGIPDFRGPKGIWTIEKLEKEQLKKQQKIQREFNRKNGNKKLKTSLIEQPINSIGSSKVKKEPISQNIPKEDCNKIEATNDITNRVQLNNQVDNESHQKPMEETGTEKKEKKSTVSLAEARPTLTHLTIKALIECRFVKFVISQNVDGLFLKTGIPRKFLSEVHGNFYLNECNVCLRRFIRNSPSPTMTLKVSSNPCPSKKSKTRSCQGFLRDTILDWEDELPINELTFAERNIAASDLIVCLGTTLQINPIGMMPFQHKKRRKEDNPLRVVIVNLQPTSKDKLADLVIHDYVDDVCKALAEHLVLKATLPEDFTDFDDSQIRPWI